MPDVHAAHSHRVPAQVRQRRVILGLFLLFLFAGFARYWNTDGEDLASSYVGCRLLATGHGEELFAYDPDNFADIGKAPFWHQLAKQGGFDGYLHPYVQTPLWGYSLQPLCNHTSFAGFSRIFCLLMMACFAASIYLILRFWAPHLLHPLPVAITLLLFSFCEPFVYAMFLMQTHALFFFLSLAALILVERERPIAGGASLALAAAVKITPGFLLVYWLVNRRWKAIGSTLLTSALLMGLTFLAVGPHLITQYFADLHRISDILLIAQNNQSFAAWAMSHFYSPDAVFDIDILPLPTAVRLGSMALLIGSIALGGWLDHRRAQAQGDVAPPMGAVMSLVAITIFAPIAWTHYFFILVAPVLVLLELFRRTRTWWLLATALIVALLNFRPFASDVIRMDIGTLALVRGQFYAGALALVALAVASLRLPSTHSRLPSPSPRLDVH